MPPTVLRIPYRPHPGQQLFHASKARFKVLACGARWGKDRSCINELIRRCVEMGCEKRPSSLVPRVHAWIVAPTFDLARQNWRELIHFTPRALVQSINRSERRMEWKNGVVIEVKSADNPDSLLAVGLDILLITEASRVCEEAWNMALRPRLASPGRGPRGSGGLGLINSTPKGRNWFWKAFLQGQDRVANPNWESWTFPTTSNPHINKALIEEARRDMPDRWFRQEFLAEFLDDAGGVFRGIRGLVNTTLLERRENPRQQFVIGIDWGKHNDFTVVTVLETDGDKLRLVAWDRFGDGLPYYTQVERIKAIIARFEPWQVIVEENGVGDPVIEQLTRDLEANVVPFTTGNLSKKHIIEHLAGVIERQEIELADVPVLINELEAFEYEMLKSGAVRYSAPSGLHDDAVMSLAFAAHGARGGGGGLMGATLPPSINWNDATANGMGATIGTGNNWGDDD